MSGGSVHFDAKSWFTLASRLVRWRNNELVGLAEGWPRAASSASRSGRRQGTVIQFLQSWWTAFRLGAFTRYLDQTARPRGGVRHVESFAQAEFLMVGMFVALLRLEATGAGPVGGSLLSFAVAFVLGVLAAKSF